MYVDQEEYCNGFTHIVDQVMKDLVLENTERIFL